MSRLICFEPQRFPGALVSVYSVASWAREVGGNQGCKLYLGKQLNSFFLKGHSLLSATLQISLKIRKGKYLVGSCACTDSLLYIQTQNLDIL